ncbi:NADP-dependent oxidoreductase [Streptosporangium sp. NPDC004379]|uniref:NADP-dependent oxidoreductase n=1 Tax=Streptosporangium sp. NPDC004379 TaxID=3366189 RepID=UPI00368C3814
MRAITPLGWGGPEVLTEIELPRPDPLPTEVLVRVHAAGVNPIDWKSRATGGFVPWDDPPILGYDVSGVVEEVGLGVRILAPGDEVFGFLCFPHQAGAYAEYVTAPARHFARKPANVSHVEAAAVPLAALTAWQALVDTAGVRPGQRVLVHAAAGGVGHFAVQLAKHLGAHVIGTARAAKHGFLRDLGADEVIDYTAVDFVTAVDRVDVVIDAVGGEYGPRSLRVLDEGGVLVSLPRGGDDLVPRARALGIRAGFMLVEPDHDGMRRIAGLLESGELRVRVETVLPLSRAAEAHRLGESGRTTGKIVLSVADRTG